MKNNLHLISNEVVNRSQLESLLTQLTGRWSLRLRCHSFIIVVCKTSNRYVNIYRKQLNNPSDLDIIADSLELHENYL